MRTVVGVAILRDGLVLAARRTGSGWEFPGGKVEPGEDPAAAAVREIAEELGCAISVTGWLAATVPIDDDLELRVATAVLDQGEPVTGEDHDAILWLPPSELGTLDWLEADRPFVAELTAGVVDDPH